jgi:hypothetical protein
MHRKPHGAPETPSDTRPAGRLTIPDRGRGEQWYDPDSGLHLDQRTAREEEEGMRRRWIVISIFALAGLAAIGTFAATTTHHPDMTTVSAGGTCATKNCPKNTHCCTGCTGNPICVRNGVPCPECAPQ